MQPKDMNNSKGFKLIAIRLLDGCKEKFRKNLQDQDIGKELGII
jgi:hypothetical protein